MNNMYIGIDGKARKVKNINVGVDGVARKVIKGWIGIDGVAKLFYQYAAANTISALPIGTEVYITEADGDAPYIIIANNHYGLGEITLLRKYVYNLSAQYFSSAPSNEFNNKYSTSDLKKFCDNRFKELPEETKGKIITTPIPCSENAYNNNSVLINSTLFPLSLIELSNEGTTYDGYWMAAAFPDAESRKAKKADGTAAAYWTRTITGGMPNYEVAINASGVKGNVVCANGRFVRPACNVLANTEIYQDGDGRYHI